MNFYRAKNTTLINEHLSSCDSCTGYLHDNYNISHANTYSENYAKMVQVALDSNIKGQYFWVIAGSKKDNNTKLEDLVSTKDMSFYVKDGLKIESISRSKN